MTRNRVSNFSSLINLQDELELAINKARAILDLLIGANLNEHGVYNLHLCLVAIDDILEGSMLFTER